MFPKKLLKIFKLENLVYLTIFFLPSYLIRFDLGMVRTNLLEILISILLFFWWKQEGWNAIFRFFSRMGHKGPISLIFFGLIMATFSSEKIVTGLGIIKGWFVFPLFFLFLVKEIVPREKRLNVFKVIYLSCFGVALISLGYLLLGKMTFDGRLEAFFNSPNYLAMYLAPGTLVGILFPPRGSLKLKTMGLGIMFLALYLTYSYAAWLALLLTLIIVFFLTGKITRRGLFLGSIILFLGIITQVDNQKFSDLVNFDDRSSLASRVMIWRSAGKMAVNHWLWGIGPGNFQEKYLEYQEFFPPYLEWAVPHPHNIFLAWWLYGGLSSVIGFLILIYKFFEEKLKKQDFSPVSLITLGIMIYLLIHGLVDTTYFKNDLAVIFWLCFL